jgi:putative DNA primase/helicase
VSHEEKIWADSIVPAPRMRFIPDDFFDGNRFNPKRLTWAILNLKSIVTIRDTGEVYIYHPETGVYRPNGETIICELANRLLGKSSRPSYVRQTLDTVKYETYKDREQVVPPKNLLAVSNGVLDIDTQQLYPFSPDYYFLNALPIRFDPEADCPQFKKFLREVVSPLDILVLQEYSGYLLEAGYPHHKVLILYGEGRNGKTTFLIVLIKFLGQVNISSVALQDFKQRFSAADLFGKRANICDDLSDKDVEQTGMFKKLTGESPVRGERKFKDAFVFINEAKMIFAANKIPRSRDNTYAYFSRII